ncbi:hypothetical protein LCDVSa021R [Lymphocystis disease virus 3]|uniref:Nucleotide-diphospho-sugar transferase domain-containing protein n=1 Tax=Lymphocystis disease virus 3 TaxID=2560566 RepID=A0A1B2RVU0_9VIRU|nr:hypothetical protein BZK12_gp021 [Lymphocystis disease virus Sa]AOC55105.1 hypothetical protein LCDVSa021R [Lymphocystis disease virus 3]
MNKIVQYLSDEFDGFKPVDYVKHKIHFVFTTWTCYRRQFMNKNQQDTLTETAEKLKLQNVSFALIYSRLDMTVETEKFVKTNFKFKVLCIEDVVPLQFYKHVYTNDLTWMDHVRIVGIKHYDKILQALDLEIVEGNSIMYVDADVEFISNQFPEIYTAKGFCSYPQLNPVFAKADVENKLKNPETAFDYVIEGKAYADARREYVLKKILFRPVIAYGENCMICVRYDAVELFKKYVTDYALSVDFHRNPNKGGSRGLDCFYMENHTFIYLQLIKHLRHRNDLSWTHV